jgi:prevent-host-death family protein
MTTVSVATLKQKLSEYLRRVEEGEEVVVTSHRRALARIVPEVDAGVRVRKPSRPIADLEAVRGVTAGPGFSAVEALLHDRSGR